MKEKLVDALIELIKPRTLFAGLFYITACRLMWQGKELNEELISIVSMLMGYYFGKQVAKIQAKKEGS